jgi:hypothetical protein
VFFFVWDGTNFARTLKVFLPYRCSYRPPSPLLSLSLSLAQIRAEMKNNGVPMELGWKFVHVLKSNQSIMFGLIAITGLSVVLFGMWG